MNPDAMKELVSQDEIGTDVTGDGAVQRVFGPAGPTTTMTNLEMQLHERRRSICAPSYQSQMNKFDLTRVFEPPQVNEEDVHKILRSVVLATPNAPKLAERSERASIRPSKAAAPTPRSPSSCRARSSR